MNGIFDSHAHYDDAAFDRDRDAALRAAYDAGVTHILTVGTDLDSSKAACALAAAYHDAQAPRPLLFAAVGIHPGGISALPQNDICSSISKPPRGDIRDKTSAPPLYDICDRLRDLAAQPYIAAIGEIGLDCRERGAAPEIFQRQRELLDAQLSLCEELRLPAILHSIRAGSATLELLRAHPRVRGVLHGFSYAAPFALDAIRLGWSIGIGSSITRPEARKVREVVRSLPLDALLIETDSPYQPPYPLRTQRGDSSHILCGIREIAALRSCPEETIITSTADNARRLFSLS